MAWVNRWMQVLLADGADRSAEGVQDTGRWRRNLTVLLISALILIVHQSFRWSWYIDDAAICFAYARNLVEGYGLVPYPGGERIEGYSDPLWVLILAVFQALGLDGFEVSKPLGMVFGVISAWATWRVAQRALPDHTARGGAGALLAPLALGCSAQFAIWSASGLENGLFCLVLTFAMLRMLDEIDALDRGETAWPWSAGLYFLLAMTRPEGVLYAMPGVALLAYAAFRAKRGLRTLFAWALAMGISLVLQEVFRIWYFAWPLPNTFYAKITSRGISPLEWNARGWVQLRNWSERIWHAYYLPLYLLGIVGAFSRRYWRALAVAGVLLLALMWPGFEALRLLRVWPQLPPPPTAFVQLRMVALCGFAAVLPALALGSPGGVARALCGWTVVVGLAFELYATGDWMSGFRFMSFITTPLAVLFAVGLTTLADELERRLAGMDRWGNVGWLVVIGGLGVLIPPNVWQTREHITYSMDETTAAVRLRAEYTRSIVRRTFWEEPVINFENDQGAHLWYTPEFRQLDMAMLIDIPMARHWFQQRPFIKEYLFQENPLTFAQVRLWWVNHTGLTKYAEFQKSMFKLPGYQSLPRWGYFDWCWARRSLVVTDKWSQKENRRVTFDWNVVMEGWEQPVPWVTGGQGYVEVPFSVTEKREPGTDVEVVAFLSNGKQIVASWTLPMGYGFYPMDWWKVGQVFRGRHAVAVPRTVQAGKYDLGFVITGPKGRVIPAIQLPPGAVNENPVFAAGEVRFPKAITVVDQKALTDSMDKTRGEFQRQVQAFACDQAERSWVRYKRHRPEDWAFHERQQPTFARPLAQCWAERAARDDARAAELLAKAHRWDPLAPALRTVGEPVAERLIREGQAARAVGDWEVAYDRFAAVLKFEPWRAWVRRWAEEARDHRLGLVDDVRHGLGGEDDLRRWEKANGIELRPKDKSAVQKEKVKVEKANGAKP